jgi:hypothetical protein
MGSIASPPLPAALVCNGALGGQFGLRLQLFFQIGNFKILGEGAFAPKIAQINPPSARKSAEPTSVGPTGGPMWLSFPSAVMIAALWSDNVVVGAICVILVTRASQITLRNLLMLGA